MYFSHIYILQSVLDNALGKILESGKFWCDALELVYRTDLLQIATFSEVTLNNITWNNQ